VHVVPLWEMSDITIPALLEGRLKVAGQAALAEVGFRIRDALAAIP
jgi:hypothetical protein